MRCAHIHLTACQPRVAPTPEIPPAIAWVVEMGTDANVASPMVVPAANSALTRTESWTETGPSCSWCDRNLETSLTFGDYRALDVHVLQGKLPGCRYDINAEK
jgi:hypothetical protein